MIEEHRLMRQLLAILEDGQPHRFTALTEALSCGLETLNGLLDSMRALGVQFDFDDARLANMQPCVSWVNPKPLVARPEIFDALESEFHSTITQLSVQLICKSTTDVVAAMGEPQNNKLHIAFSEYQTTGRGRRNGIWHSPLASGICLTLATSCPPDSSISGSLTLAIGVALCNALDEMLTESVLLKWPNDLVLKDRKLGGILTQVAPHPDDGFVISVGIGINVDTVDVASFNHQKHALPPIGLGEFLKQPVSRAQITARIIYHVAHVIEQYQIHGFNEFRERWNHRDYLRHQRIRVLNSEQLVGGIAQGVDEHGALIVDVDGIKHQLFSGEVRVRPE